eukprot:2724565-Rhodomonas_salina.1
MATQNVASSRIFSWMGVFSQELLQVLPTVSFFQQPSSLRSSSSDRLHWDVTATSGNFAV